MTPTALGTTAVTAVEIPRIPATCPVQNTQTSFFGFTFRLSVLSFIISTGEKCVEHVSDSLELIEIQRVFETHPYVGTLIQTVLTEQHPHTPTPTHTT